MKKIFSGAFLVFLSLSCLGNFAFAQGGMNNFENRNLAKIFFETQTIDAGVFAPESSKEIEVIVKNIGKEPLIIHGVFSTAAFIKAKYPQEPIFPGKSGKIILTITPNSAFGFTKTVEVKSNGEKNSTYLTVTGKVTN